MVTAQKNKTVGGAQLTVIVAFACVYFFWGSTYLAIRIGARELPALLLAGTRFLIAGGIMLIFCKLRGERLLAPWRAMLLNALVGLLLLSCGNVGLVYGEKFLSSGLASLLIAIVPVYIALIELFLPGGESLPARGWWGMLFGFAGLGALMWPSIQEGLRGDRGRLLGATALLAGAIGWAAGSILSRRKRLPINPFVAAGWQMVASGLFNSLLAAARGEYAGLHLSSRGAGALLYLITGGSLIGYTAYVYLLEHVPVAKAATYAYVNPLVAVLLGALVLGERLEWSEYAGMAVVVFAVFLITTATIRPSIAPQELEQCPPE